jgi:hypothetical protein
MHPMSETAAASQCSTIDCSDRGAAPMLATARSASARDMLLSLLAQDNAVDRTSEGGSARCWL